MHLADAITVKRFVGGSLPIEDMHSLALVALYVEERFSIIAPGAQAAVQTIGAEIEDDFLFVYQEWETTLPGVFPAVENRLRLDVEPQAQAFIKILGPGLNEERKRTPPR
ncbi:MAG: hypothetical protein ACI87W_003239 [Halieaceae bacterium]|jgi:hypothetical protein